MSRCRYNDHSATMFSGPTVSYTFCVQCMFVLWGFSPDTSFSGVKSVAVLRYQSYVRTEREPVARKGPTQTPAASALASVLLICVAVADCCNQQGTCKGSVMVLSCHSSESGCFLYNTRLGFGAVPCHSVLRCKDWAL